METIRFWYTFEDKDKDSNMPVTDVDISVSSEAGVGLGDVCEAFVHFIEAAGYSSANLSEYFSD